MNMYIFYQYPSKDVRGQRNQFIQVDNPLFLHKFLRNIEHYKSDIFYSFMAYKERLRHVELALHL